MTIVRLRWVDNAATDIHLLPNHSSPELAQLLLVDDLTGTTVTSRKPADVPGLTLTFLPQWKIGVDHGVDVDEKTGKVTVRTAAIRGHNFIIKVQVDQDPTITTRVRVHVHETLSSLWLTPSPMTVRQGAERVRFSVIALFDQVVSGTLVVKDGITGDISNWSPFLTPTGGALTYVHLKDTTTPALTWAATGGPITVDPLTGFVSAPVDNGPPTKVTATAGGQSGNANALCAKAWTTPVKLDHLAGPGVNKISDVPNILFLPDGFEGTDKDKKDYERFVRIVRDRLGHRSRSRPFAALTGRVNYWRGWVPSRQPGVSVLNEHKPASLLLQDVEASRVPLPSENRPATNWSIEDMVNAIGLPNPDDYPVGTTLASKIDFLRNLYGDHLTPALLGPRFDQWLALGSRLVINERDTAFHCAFGERPSIFEGSVDREVFPNRRRLTDSDFNKFLDALRGPKDEALPPGLWTTGKDQALVVIICKSRHLGGVAGFRRVSPTDFGRTIALSLDDHPTHRVEPALGGLGIDLKPDDVPNDVFFPVWLTTAHELGHAFGLLDEYGGDPKPPTALEILNVADHPNVQDRDSLINAGIMDVTRIKWHDWPRIAKAGVLKNGLTPPVGGRFTVDVVDVKASRLEVDDIVKFRRRPLATAGAPSDICKVIAVDVPNNRVFVQPMFGGSVDPARFPAGSTVFAYVRRPDPDFANDRLGGILTLADPDVFLRIATTQNPLNAQPLAGEATGQTDNMGRPCTGRELKRPTPATNFPGRIAPQAISSFTIGIYENAATHNCGIFRPTGTCIMLRKSFLDPKTSSLNLYDFCLVCRYSMIDMVDPTLHGEVERDFRDRYGRQGAR
jgi:hypothetical protein